jgi:hypothetical protein
MVLTAAMQGYRASTRLDSPAGVAKRRAFALHIPHNILVMIDEAAGDGAGAPFVHEIATWLEAQFIAPFEEAPSSAPFKVMLSSYLGSYLGTSPGTGSRAKVLVSPSAGTRPFRLAASLVRVGSSRSLAST